MCLKFTLILLFLSQLMYSFGHAEETTTESNKQRLSTPLPNLPANHLIRYLNTFPQVLEECAFSEECQRAIHTNVSETNAYDAAMMISEAVATASMPAAACWGHELDCDVKTRFQTPTCPGEHNGWVQSKTTQVSTFYYQADFGYIQQQISELSLMCEPRYITDSSLECSKYLRFCRGRNLLFDFRDLANRKELIRYHMDVLKPRQLLGHCQLNRTRLEAELDHMGALQSWAPELRNFDELPMSIMTSSECDLVVDTPTFIMKIDATYNMYHHFCDFFNLYASLFVNQSHPLAFHTDSRILVWETYPYDSPFAETFKAFSDKRVWTLNDVKGKRVCFRNVVLPLLPRMIFGLFYNTPLINGCQGSGLFRAFSEFILHRLQIPYRPPLPQAKLRITLLSRRTKYRQILNEDELLEEIAANNSYHVQRISFERGLSFSQQLAITRNTDILIGMHGAGLTHLLFLPNWGTIFELYNCEDPNCYKDLARLRGIDYITWERDELLYPQDEGHHPQGGAHAKFTNYRFDPKEFVRLVARAAEHVWAHIEFQKFHTQKSVNLQASQNKHDRTMPQKDEL
ncbi:EGF domain-specific O-linked N-acetylglucosamine transferase [Anastrepha obliqua]|uniref:EGF domain-specific O-linked N-acetylglucosamine transferase n=1 Tax=Anastrepha obliqua TaxID=95512 RepID=UPI00240A6596|nr:EGF domain-specific O-linked N-acetylglucosamine transferase [Anastrepha obliqua]XP_054743721.1 EGF domain-specific O-linked N-acetylglucosamine transferase [Anastrepha obliqua]